MRRVVCAAVGALSLAAPPAWQAAAAQGRAATPALGDGPPRGARLSQAQLRACLDLQPQVTQQSEAITRAKAELDADKLEFDRFEAQLKTDRDRLDTGDKAAVDAYNARLEQRQRMVAEYTAAVPAFSERAQAYNALQQRWSRDCDDRPYDEDDYAAVHGAR